MSGRTRRTVLGSVVGALALAGCSESTSLGSDVFERVAVEGTELVVEFTSADVADELSVIDPNGSSFAERSLAAGETLVTVELGVGYAPGEYEILALEEGEEVATTTTTIQPDLEIVDAAVGANYPEEMPESFGRTRDVEAFVKIRNRGSGPTAVRRLNFSGDIPNPTDLDSENSGILDVETTRGERDRVIVSADSEKRLFSTTLPFAFGGDGVNCQSEEQMGELLISIESSHRSEIRRSFEVYYPGAEEYNGCTPEIVGEE